VTFPTEPERGFPDAVARIANGIEQALAKAKLTTAALAGIGIGCTGPVNPVRGTIHNPYTLSGWDDCNLVAPLAERFQMPVRMENDADEAAVGEYFAGAGKGCDPVVMLTFGTGIGGAAIGEGKSYRGVRGGNTLNLVTCQPFTMARHVIAVFLAASK
jgi:glucokinase